MKKVNELTKIEPRVETMTIKVELIYLLVLVKYNDLIKRAAHTLHSAETEASLGDTGRTG